MAWGFRNPYGLAFDSSKNTSRLWITSAGADERGSRPIANDSDKIYSIDTSNRSNIGKFYGWPDFFGNAEPVTNHKFQSSKSNQSLQFLMAVHPPVQKPSALVNNSAEISQISFSNNTDFGFKDMAFISEFGNIGNSTDHNSGNNPPVSIYNNSNNTKIKNTAAFSSTNQSLILNNNKNFGNASISNTDKIKGQKIIIFDPKSKRYFDFLSLKNPDPSFRPLDAKFSPDGNTLYITSFGKTELRNTIPNKGFQLPSPTPWVYKYTGVLWKVTKLYSNSQPDTKAVQNKIHLSKELNVTINSGVPPNSLQNYLKIPPGYRMEPILWNLNLPGSFAFDDKGNAYFASTGITYGKVSTTPAIYKISKNGTVSLLADRPLHGILSDIEFDKNNGLLYVAHRDIISTVNVTSGVVKDLVVGLPMPAYVTHPLGQLAISPDGRIFFSVGGLSNTAVPDISDWGIGWIRDMPFMHEIPGANITLTGQNFTSDNFLTTAPNDKATTGGMMPFGTPSYKGEKIKGETLCTSCILSIKPDGSDLRLHAWGIRNAYGMTFDEKGRLFLFSNGADDKGIRRVTNDPDVAFTLDPDKKNITFFGWPDFYGSLGEPVTKHEFNESPFQNYTLEPLIQNPPSVTHPLLSLGMSVAVTQSAYSSNDKFGYKGKIFVGEFGTIAPITHTFHSSLEGDVGGVMGKVIGQKIAIVDPQNRTVNDFITLSSPASSFRPVGLQFTPDGSALYLASIEKEVVRKVTPMGGELPTSSDYPYLQTGTIWKIIKVSNNFTKSSSSSSSGGNEPIISSSIDAPYSGNNSTDIFMDK